MKARTVLRPTSARLEDFDLTATEAFVLTRIDGSSALADVAELTGVPIAKVITIARRLEQIGAVDAVEGQRSQVVVMEETSPPPRTVTHRHLPLAPRRTTQDVYRMKLAPGDAFLLSYVDGQLSIAELADLIGWAPGKALRSVEALLAHGAVEMDLPPARASKAPAPRHSQRPRTARPPTKAPPPAAGALDAESVARVEAALLDAAGPSHHALLGVVEGVSATELRRAYFARAAKLHPDRYFGKDLGPYRKKLDEAFRRLTDAYEALRRESPRGAPEAAPRVASKAPPKTPTKIPTKLPTKAPPKIPTKRPSMRPSKRPPKVPSNRPSMRPSKGPARPGPTAASIAAASKAGQFLLDAQKALSENNAAGAANLFRLAHQIAVDAATRGIAELGLQNARAALADSYAKSARAAEKKSQWSAAAEAYGKAVQHRSNDPELCERLANALREEGQDLKRAVAMAESAVALAPRRSAFRRTLGRIHAAAGQRALALEQLEAAVALEPDEETRSLIAKLRKRG